MKTHPIRFGIASGQQNYELAKLRHLWQTADRLGYDSLWTGDHLYAILTDPAEPAFEGWTTLAALSEHTNRARIGSLVNCNNFRNPCLTAKMAVTLDHASRGRFILGLGAGWFEHEHRSLGFDFKPTPERLAALDEACKIITQMLEHGTATFRGKHYQVADAICSPRPIQAPRPPLMIAGQGEKILLRIVAEHADMWNAQGSPERMSHLTGVIRGHADKIGRDADEIEKTVAIPLCYRADRDREEHDTRFAAALGRTSPEEARKQMMIGGKQECLDKIERYATVGVTHFIFISLRPFATEEIAAFADEVIAAVRTT
jgi:F420-dependent oxidoreductase-like protein